jgi:hypothetical protein
VLYDSDKEKDSGIRCYCEQSGFDGGIFVEMGEVLLQLLLQKNI